MGTVSEDPPEEEPDDEPETTDPPIDAGGGSTETGSEDPVVSGEDSNSGSTENLADTVNNDASSFQIQDAGLELRSDGLATTYAYADNQQLEDLVFQFATTKLSEKLVLSTFDPTFIANVFWDELDNANRELSGQQFTYRDSQNCRLDCEFSDSRIPGVDYTWWCVDDDRHDVLAGVEITGHRSDH